MARYIVLVKQILKSCSQVFNFTIVDLRLKHHFYFCLILQQKDLPLNTTEMILKQNSSEADEKYFFFLIDYTTSTILELISSVFAILFIKGRSSNTL